MLLLAGCRLPSVESFTGLTPMPRATQQRQVYHTSVSRVHQRGTAVMMVKPTEAALAKETRVDPAVVEAALVEEDKNV